jgi:hypothetical protein
MHRLLLVAAIAVALLTDTPASGQPLTSQIPAWERYFEISSTPFERRGKPWLSGYVVSRWGETATNVKLLIDSLDATGRIVTQRVEWMSGPIPVYSRAYFEVPAPPPAASYRVSVYSFDFPQAARVEAP